MKTMTEDVQQDDIFNRENLRRALRFVYLKVLQPAGATGTIATFDAVIPGLLKIKRCSLKRRTGESIRLVTARLEAEGGFSVELRSWLRDAILRGAVAALRGKLEGELVALAKNDAHARGDIARHGGRHGNQDLAKVADDHVANNDNLEITPDAAALPAQLLRAVA